METQDAIQTGIPDPCILLGGQPRSGTTMLSSMLRCAPGHFQAFELHIRKPSFVVGLEGRYTRNIFRDLGLPPQEFDALVSAHGTAGMNLGAWVGPKEEVSAEPLSGRETEDFPGELAARAALTTVLMRRTAERHNATRWGFKILGDIVYADLFARAWPNATFILLVRDPRDQATSLLKLNEQRVARQQQTFYDTYREAAAGWRNTIETARRVMAQHRLRCVETRYEDLAMQPEREAARLSAALGLDLTAGLEFHRADFVDTHTKRFKHHDNLRNPVNAASVGRWKETLAPADAAVFAEVSGDLMKDFGYL